MTKIVGDMANSEWLQIVGRLMITFGLPAFSVMFVLYANKYIDSMDKMSDKLVSLDKSVVEIETTLVYGLIPRIEDNAGDIVMIQADLRERTKDRFTVQNGVELKREVERLREDMSRRLRDMGSMQ